MNNAISEIKNTLEATNSRITKSIPGQGERALQPKTRSDEDLWGWQRSSLRPLPRQAKKVTHWWQGENFRLLICLSLVIPVSH